MEVEKVSVWVDLCIWYVPKYLASPKLVMAHLVQYAPLLSIRANGALSRGVPLLNLREGGPE